MRVVRSHRCPVQGCGTLQVPNTMLMCARHWRRVTPATQREVYAAYKEKPASDRHVAAMKLAIEEASGKSQGGLL